MADRKHIVLIDDEAIVRSWLKEHINQSEDMIVVAEARDGHRGLEIIKDAPERIDLIVLDLALPGHNGFELLDEVKNHRPEARVIIYTQHRDPAFVRKCKQKANAYMLKEEPVSRILSVLEIVLRGREYYSPALSYNENDGGQDEFSSERLLFEKLTEAQKEIVICVKDGMTSKEIGEKLGKSPRTVEEQLGRIYKRLSLRNRADLASFAVRARVD